MTWRKTQRMSVSAVNLQAHSLGSCPDETAIILRTKSAVTWEGWPKARSSRVRRRVYSPRMSIPGGNLERCNWLAELFWGSLDVLHNAVAWLQARRALHRKIVSHIHIMASHLIKTRKQLHFLPDWNFWRQFIPCLYQPIINWNIL